MPARERLGIVALVAIPISDLIAAAGGTVTELDRLASLLLSWML